MTAAVGFAATAVAAAHVFVESIDDDESDLWVDGDDGHHLQRVRRLRSGESVTASDGRGAWRVCEIAEVGEGRLRLTPTGPRTVEPALTPRVVIAFAPAKGDSAGTVVHQLVEIGVDAVMPITLARSVVRWDGTKGERPRARLGRVIREAAMQSRRSRLPDLLDAVPLAELASHPGLILGDPGGEPADATELPRGDEWLVIIGPEGGLDSAERQLVAAASRLAVGPHVLRAVTAPVAAAGALAALRHPLPPDPQ